MLFSVIVKDVSEQLLFEEDEPCYGVIGIKIELFDMYELLKMEEGLKEVQYDYYFSDEMKLFIQDIF